MALAFSFCCLPTLYAIPKVGQKSHIVKESASSLQRFNEAKTEDFIFYILITTMLKLRILNFNECSNQSK